MMTGLLGPTAFLCLIHVAMLTGESRTQFFGLALGFGLFAGVSAYGPGANFFNPAIRIGTYLARGLLGAGFGAPLAELAYLATGAFAAGLAAIVYHISSMDGLVGVVTTEFIGTAALTSLIFATADSPPGTMAQAIGVHALAALAMPVCTY